MRFLVRQGFVCSVVNEVDVGGGNVERQETMLYPTGRSVDLTAKQAADHAHKLEPADEEATAWLAAMHMPVPESAPFGLSAAQMQALTLQIAQQLALQQVVAPSTPKA